MSSSSFSEIIFQSNFNISDLNELASEIGKECEKLISIYGSNCTSEIVAKCIEALEMLEALAMEREKLKGEMKEMQERIFELENKKNLKDDNQKAFEKDIEAMEELWTTELNELRHKMRQLEDENQKLIADHRRFKISSLDNLAGSLYAEEYKLNETLKNQLTKLEFELKLKEKDILAKDIEIRHLNEEVEFLRIEQNQMRRKSRVTESQVKTLYEEREEILAGMKGKSLIVLKDHFAMAQMENEDLALRTFNDPTRPRFTLEEMNSVMQERNELIKKVDELEGEIVEMKMEKIYEQRKSSEREEEKLLMKVKSKPVWMMKINSIFSKVRTEISGSHHDFTTTELLNISSSCGSLYKTPI